MDYLPRIVDTELDLRLRAVGATVIVGPKWCGKTTTAKQKAKSVLEMQDPDLQEGYLTLASTKPSLLLEGDNPRLIDEWQLAPVLWDAVRVSVDRRQEKGVAAFVFTIMDGDTPVSVTQAKVQAMVQYAATLAGGFAPSTAAEVSVTPDGTAIRAELKRVEGRSSGFMKIKLSEAEE